MLILVILCLLYNTCQILIFFKFTLILDLYINYDSPQRSISFNEFSRVKQINVSQVSLLLIKLKSNCQNYI